MSLSTAGSRRWLLLGALVLPLACERPSLAPPVIVANVTPVSAASALPPLPSPAPVATARLAPLRWVGTGGGGVAWLPRDEGDPDGEVNGSIHSVGDAWGVETVLQEHRRAAVSITASGVCAAVPALIKVRDRMSLDLDIMSKIDASASACVQAVRPRAFSFMAEHPLPAPSRDLLVHLDECEALGVDRADDEVALLLGSRVSSPDGAALRSVTFALSSLSADGLRALASRTNLRSIGLRGLNRFRSKKPGEPTGLAALATLPDLERLDLSYGPVTDEDLAAFSGAHALRWLMLEATDISDAGIMHLSGSPELTYVNLDFTKVGDAAVLALGGLAHLQTLRLVRTAVSDRALVALGRMKELRRLDLALTNVTDAGLEHLANLSSLRELSLPNTVTQAATARWQAAHPKTQVSRYDLP